MTAVQAKVQEVDPQGLVLAYLDDVYIVLGAEHVETALGAEVLGVEAQVGAERLRRLRLAVCRF